jgi:hypothetical protein
MKKKTFVLLLIVSGAIVIVGLVSIISSILTRYYGKEVQASVLFCDTDCDRYNSIRVLYSGREYEVAISLDDCIEKRYRIGQRIMLLKRDGKDQLVWPESQPVLALVIVFIALALGIWTNRKRFSGRP